VKPAHKIAERLTQVIPLPRVAPPTPQSSWAALKLGDRLTKPQESAQRLSEWEVVGVDSGGLTLRCGSDTMLLADRNWKANGWRKLPKRRPMKSEEVSL